MPSQLMQARRKNRHADDQHPAWLQDPAQRRHGELHVRQVLQHLLAEDDIELLGFDRRKAFRVQSKPCCLPCLEPLLESLPPDERARARAALARTARFGEHGTITVVGLAELMVEHDAGHRSELEDLFRTLGVPPPL